MLEPINLSGNGGLAAEVKEVMESAVLLFVSNFANPVCGRSKLKSMKRLL